MKYLHSVKISVFSKPEDDEKMVKSALFTLFPFDLEREKLELKTQNATGFGERKIKIFEVVLKKQRHTSDFLKHLLIKIGADQKSMILSQKESRLDDNLNFFVRLDKEKLLRNEYYVTDFGNCFHIRFSIAAFPAKKENALRVVEKMLGD